MLIQFTRINRHIALAGQEGARRVAGGCGIAPSFARGFYTAPTVFYRCGGFNDTCSRSRIWAGVMRCGLRNGGRGIAYTNGTRFGLPSAV